MPRRILIVEDDPNGVEAIGRCLKRSGIEIRTARDGLQALQAAEQFLPDVMLVDTKLPKLTGYQVADRIRHHPWGERTILIALSGWFTEEQRVRAHEAGFNAILLKPFDYAEVFALLAE